MAPIAPDSKKSRVSTAGWFQGGGNTVTAAFHGAPPCALKSVAKVL